jgi:hypothetical protein
MGSVAQNSLDILFDFIEAPKRAAESVREDPPLGLGLAAYVASAVGLFLANALAGRFQLFGVSWVSLLVTCLWHVLIWLMMSSLLHLVAEAAGGEGRALPLFVLLGLSNLVWTLALPGVLLVQALELPRLAISLLFSIIGFLGLYLQARSIGHNYQVSPAQAWITLAVPYLGAGALILLMISLAIWGVIAQILKLAV